MGRDFVIPGVDPPEPDPYRFHTGRKRDHGGEDAIEIIDLVKQFGRARILNGLNLGLPEDQVSMVLGPSGTGKSVLIKHIVGLLYPDSGDVLVHGESIPNMTDDELFEVRKKFGLLFQDGALFGSMNIYDNTAFPLRQHTDKSEEEIGEIVNRRLKEVGLTEATYKMPNELSGGMRKRAGFARALVLEPAIVMFDEPDSGPRPGPHGAALRADPRGPRRERRLLPGDQPRPRHRAPDRRLHRRAVERQDRRVGPERGAVRLRATRSSASSSTLTSPARSRADRRLPGRPLERQDRRVGAERRTLRLRKRLRRAVPQGGRDRSAVDGLRDRYTILVGLVFLRVIAVAVVNTIGQGGEGTLGLDQRPARWPLPEFAVPDAAGPLEGDANVAQDDCETSQLPCPEGARRTPACRDRGRRARSGSATSSTGPW